MLGAYAKSGAISLAKEKSGVVQLASIVRFVFAIALSVVTISIAMSQALSQEQAKIDFDSQVRPILESHCYECHGADKTEGDLRLDSKAALLSGGHTGNSILGSANTESELLLRIGSTEKGYRMPKSGSPLSEADISTLQRWVDQGAPWPQVNVPSDEQGKGSKDKSLGLDWLVKQYLRLERPEVLYPTIVVGIGLVAIVLVLLNQWLRRRERVKKKQEPVTAAPKSRALILAIAFSTALLGFIAYQRGVIESLSTRPSDTSLKNFINQDAKPSKPPRIFKPMHPPRLGGTYYRGNDERDAALYNGGFYRTAELEVHLVGSNGQRIGYGDTVELSKLAIEFSAKRAKGATQALFSERTLKTSYLSKQFDPKQPGNDRVMLKPIKLDEHWQATYSIGQVEGTASPSLESPDKLAGSVYVFYGPLNHSRIHYVIGYSLSVDEAGAMLSSSEIWMASAYNLNGRVLVPQDGQMSLQHWFDHRPIPEIQGENSLDPELLGLPEHLESKDD